MSTHWRVIGGGGKSILVWGNINSKHMTTDNPRMRIHKAAGFTRALLAVGENNNYSRHLSTNTTTNLKAILVLRIDEHGDGLEFGDGAGNCRLFPADRGDLPIFVHAECRRESHIAAGLGFPFRREAVRALCHSVRGALSGCQFRVPEAAVY